ncbi:MAG: amidohydrolase family protein [Bacillota bacterium]|nr:amidohydrolase family protein [Bacillota bacterium]
MAFGLFKKTQHADLIFCNGTIYTSDFNQPKAEAVAVKDGRILWVGAEEEMEPFRGPHTEEWDLEGAYLLPGFIELKGHPVLRTFLHRGLKLETEAGRQEAAEALGAFAAGHPELPAYFGFGYSDLLFSDQDHLGAKELLDAVCPDKPVLLLSRSGRQGWCNSCALEMAEAFAREDRAAALALQDDDDEEEENQAPSVPGFLQDPQPGVHYFTRDEEGWPTGVLMDVLPILFVIDAADPFCVESLPEAAEAAGRELSRRGYTSVFDCGGPDYLDNYYIAALTTLLQEGLPPHRFFGSVTLMGNPHPQRAVARLLQKNTACLECSEFMAFTTLRVLVTEYEGALTPRPEILEALCVEAGDRGCNVQLFPQGEAAMEAAVNAFSALRRAGYKKNRLILSYDASSSWDAETGAILQDLAVILDGPREELSAEAAIDSLTIDAAWFLRRENELGSIEKGKAADFVLLEQDPYQWTGPLSDIPVAMTFLGGEAVYEKEEEGEEEEEILEDA